ncbi:hypothetical protein [Anaeromyxobacter paludicola]|uniref:Uncharacterized protein n=1 Tax=Anaeromyxobacter paludicola TaxID=2918171 RepID=A0ABN6NEN6_9BACT|nr:hypothetical protein [Anaeromyxobacter paludicola]BDG10522.1 hypothetical protein AMPC_36350 [Anaeromyxobacter paludicola]
MTEHSHSEGRPTAVEPDVISTGKLVVVGFAAMLVFLLASLAAARILQTRRDQLNPGGPPPYPSELGKPKIGMVEQQLFDKQTRARELLRKQRAQLAGYGWIDKEKGVIHIPIDEAIDRLVKGERP